VIELEGMLVRSEKESTAKRAHVFITGVTCATPPIAVGMPKTMVVGVCVAVAVEVAVFDVNVDVLVTVAVLSGTCVDVFVAVWVPTIPGVLVTGTVMLSLLEQPATIITGKTAASKNLKIFFIVSPFSFFVKILYLVAISVFFYFTVITVLTSVTEAPRLNTLPLRTVKATLPAVEKAAPALQMIVPSISPPPAALMTAEDPTCQYTFAAFA
jgi:hypothetical protein